MNNGANIKQFQLLKFINENCDDDHVISRITIVLRRDKLEAPYYINSKISLSTCMDKEENGMIHAMDILNHSRLHNMIDYKYEEIKSLILDLFGGDHESDMVEFSQNDQRLKISLMSKNDDEFRNLYENYHELFEMMDNLID
ncbi:hypothetical protein [Methanobrevibacter sp.]|uniref:hypothetical protein n=1 Tax=Methanobrevibacter sp. TaxID=66852 RepID=UPI0025FE8062|nr:hypothetical protein [Methanobrevibacter sp.]MBQ2961529.1 hypothetical protein [Methanobrevibacter sp.]